MLDNYLEKCKDDFLYCNNVLQELSLPNLSEDCYTYINLRFIDLLGKNKKL